MAIELVTCSACRAKNASHRTACIRCSTDLAAREVIEPYNQYNPRSEGKEKPDSIDSLTALSLILDFGILAFTFAGPALMIIPSLLAAFGWDRTVFGWGFSETGVLRCFFVGAGLSAFGLMWEMIDVVYILRDPELRSRKIIESEIGTVGLHLKAIEKAIQRLDDHTPEVQPPRFLS